MIIFGIIALIIGLLIITLHGSQKDVAQSRVGELKNIIKSNRGEAKKSER